MRIYLVGMMGAGKSYTGKKIAEKLAIPFIDLDDMIEKGEEMTITDIFEQHGEAHFRSLEKKYLLISSSQKDLIVATGGGAPCFNGNMDWINANGCSIYLKATADVLVHRLQNEQDNRPIVKGLGAIALGLKLEQMIEERSVFYEMAHIVYHQGNQEIGLPNELLNITSTLIG